MCPNGRQLLWKELRAALWDLWDDGLYHRTHISASITP
jgi:hypothetical protein